MKKKLNDLISRSALIERSIDTVPIVYREWKDDYCTECGYGVESWNNTSYCLNCGTKMKMNNIERLRARNKLLQSDIRLLEAGREAIIAQAEACTTRANKNAEAYIKIKAENTKLRELVKLAVADFKIIQETVQEITRTAQVGGEYKCVVCNEKDCQHCGYGDHWEWQHADKLKEV